MGYRNHIGYLPKREYNKIKSVTLEEFGKIENSSPYEIAPSIYEFGKYCDFETKGLVKNFFKNKEVNAEYTEDNEFWVVERPFLKKVIESYTEKIKTYYLNMLKDVDANKEETWTKEKFASLFHHVRDFSIEWNYLTPYDLDDGEDSVTSSWKYEYGLFELVRIYKNFDWKKNVMVYYGY